MSDRKTRFVTKEKEIDSDSNTRKPDDNDALILTTYENHELSFHVKLAYPEASPAL